MICCTILRWLTVRIRSRNRRALLRSVVAMTDARDGLPSLTREDVERGCNRGHHDMICLLPRQQVAANKAFAPTVDQVAYARFLTGGYRSAEAAGNTTIAFDVRGAHPSIFKGGERAVQFAQRIRAQ